MSDQLPPASKPGARRAPKSSRLPRRHRPQGGARALREVEESTGRGRRTRSLPATVGMTVLAALVPGSGYLYAGRRVLGSLLLLVWLAAVGFLAWYFVSDVNHAIDLAFHTTLVRMVAYAIVFALVVWAFVVFTSHRLVRQRTRPGWHTGVGYAVASVLVLAGAAPAIQATRYLLVTADAVDTVFADDVESATIPDATPEDPWAGQDRVNVLLLGGDGGEDRTGVRTDSVILVSMDTQTGKTVMFSLPRNMMYAQFPEDSPLHDIYPDGYQTGLGDAGFDMLNAIYREVPELHPGILGKSDNEGADAIKQAVSGSLGVPVDYYLLVNLQGFKEVVDAMGGITVNINEKVAINGNTDAGIPPTDYLDPGPDQHLDGFQALWFARGRYGADDYQRMDRQRCAVDALIDAADPATLLTRYIDIARAGKEIVYTDIPRKLGSAFVQLLLEVKDAKVKSVVFKPSARFNSSDPDYDYMREVVSKALGPKKKRGGGDPDGNNPEDPVDACSYQPTETYSASE